MSTKNETVEDLERQEGVMADDSSLDPSEFEEQQDEHFADEGDVNFDLVPTASDRRRRMTPRNRIIVCSLLLVLAVMLAIFFSGSKASTTSSSTPTVALAEPPADLDTACSLKAMADDGKEECLEHCERAECCDFPENLPLSCLQGNQQKCLVYHAACSHLAADQNDQSNIPSSVPPAPSNLGELCTVSSIRTVDGFTGCHAACKHAECCYEKGVGTCTHDECAGYAPCLTLGATDHIHEDIAAAVDQVCATDSLSSMEGRAECRQACSHALCCFSQESSCPHQDTSFCSQYDKCNDLESVQPVEATPEEIQLTCQDNEDVAGHISLCELVCQQGACCFSDVGCDQVAPGTQCSDYEPCRKVFVGNGNVETPMDNVDTPTDEPNEYSEDGDDTIDNGGEGYQGDDDVDWSPQSLDKESIDAACESNRVVEVVQLPDQPSLCEQVCLPGTCCFDKSVTCDVDDPERFCTIYSACSRLHPNDDEDNENPPVDEEALREACEKEDLDECEDLCQQGVCCFEGGGACDVPHPERFCAHFGYCDALDAEDEFDDEEGDGDDGIDDDEFDDDEVDDNDEEDFEEIAGDDAGEEDVDESWIDQVGGDGNDEQGESGSTPEDDQIVEITDIDGTVVGADVLHAACAENSPKCETLCEQGACCFNSQCSVDDPELFCSVFDGHCDKFFFDEDESDDDDDEVEGDEQDESWVDQLDGGNGDGDNEDADESWIDELGDGESGGNGDDESDTVIVEIEDVNGQIVGEDVLRTACETGSVKCETLCKQGACCFEGGCSMQDPERFCVAFGVCEKYYQGE